MAKRESFLLRIDPGVLAALRRWAEDDLRSLNGQLEWVLRSALKEAGRLPKPGSAPAPEDSSADESSEE